jgi:two-component system chemotaxis response regulator CheY
VQALVVDDSGAMRRIVSSILESAGFETISAGNGQEALDVLAQTDELPALACIDLHMPVMNGLDFVHAVRGQERLRSITLMMVSTEGEVSRIVRALAAGAHEYLTKPFSPEALLEKLEALGLTPESDSS